MRIGGNTAPNTDLTGDRKRPGWDTDPAVLDGNRDPERKVRDEARDRRSLAAYASERDPGKNGNLAG